jgi:hypothetical protein
MRRRPANRSTADPHAPQKPPPKPSPKPLPPALRPLVLIAAALLLMGWFVTAVANPDTWWHLEAGRYIVQTHHLPSPDPFAFTTAAAKPAYAGEETVRRFNLTHEWLAQSIFYLAWAGGGWAGGGWAALILLRAAMLTAFCGLAGLVAFHRTGGLYRSLAAAIATAAIAGNFAVDRPFLFTYLLLAGTIYILETARSRRTVWLLPPLFLLWANCHGGYFLGWVALAAYCIPTLLRRAPDAPPSGARRLWTVSALCVLVSGLNPNGFRALAVTLAYRSSALQSSLWEWRRPQLWPPDLFAAVLFLAAAALLWQFRQVRLSDWILFAAFAAASLLAIRNTILIGWLGPLLIAAYLPFAPPRPRWSEFAAAALLLAGVAGEIVSGNAFQLRAEEWLYPKGAADFLLAHRIRGPIFNVYEHGGYLMWRLWPREKVFIDGRALSDTLFHDYQRMLYALPADSEKSGLQLLDAYGIQTIVVNGFEYGSGAIYMLPVALSDPSQTEWKLVYQDAQAMVFLRHPPPGVTPLASVDALASLESQCSAHIEHLPGEPLCARYLGILFTRGGQPERGARWTAVFRQLAGAGQ